MGSLAFWSLIALIIRAAAILVFIYLTVNQFKELKRKDLRPLARLLFYFFVATALTATPLLYLNYLRVIGETASNDVTSVATVTNAIGFLLAAILLLLIYKYKDPYKGDD